MGLFGKRRSKLPRHDQNDASVNPRSGLTDIDCVNDGEEDRLHQAVINQSSVTPDMYPEPNSMHDADKGGEGVDPNSGS
jgi:hypothetical protein